MSNVQNKQLHTYVCYVCTYVIIENAIALTSCIQNQIM